MQFQPRSSSFGWRFTVPVALRGQLSSLGQIYFQSSPVFGAALLLCLCLADPVLAFGALACGSVALGTAWAMGFPDDDRIRGLYSFNAALSGVGLCARYQLSSGLVGWLALTGVVTAVVSRAAQKQGVPVLTSLFVLAMWATAAAAPYAGLLPAAGTAQCLIASPGYVPCALGQASFFGAAPPGMLLVAALLWCDWRAALWALGGAALAWSVLAMAAATAPDMPLAVLATGMGVNCALSALGLSVHGVRWPLRLAGVAVCIALSALAGAGGISCYTMPFVLAIWMVLFLGKYRCVFVPKK